MNKVLNRLSRIPLGFYSQVISLLLSLPSLVIITRSIEIDDYGSYSLFQRIAFCVGVIGSFGYFTSIAHRPEDFRRIRSINKNLAFLVIFITQILMLYLISLAIHLNDSSLYSLYILIVSNIPIMYFLNLFRGEGREFDFFICKVTIPAAYALILIFLSFSSIQFSASLLIEAMAYVQIGVVFILVFLETKYRRFGTQVSNEHSISFHKYSISIWIPGIFVEARNFLEPIIVNQYTSPKIFGAYAFSLTVSSLPIFIGVYYATFLPSKMRLKNIEPKKLMKQILLKGFIFSICLSGVTAIAVIVLFKYLSQTYSDTAFTSTLLYLIIAPFLSANIIFLQYFLFLRRTAVNVFSVTFYLLAISIALSTIKPVGSAGIISIIGVTSITVLFLNFYLFNRSNPFAVTKMQYREDT